MKFLKISTIDKKLSSKQKGVILMCFSTFLFSVMQIIVRLTNEIPIMEQLFFRNIISLFICAYIINKHGGTYFGGKRYQPLLMLRSVFGMVGILTMFYAVRHANQADVTIIIKMSPFFIVIWAAIFLHEKIYKIQYPTLILAFIGALLVFNPVFKVNMLPLIMAFACAIAASVSSTLLSYFNNRVNGITIVMHFSTFCVFFALPFMIVNYVPLTLSQLGYLILLGIFGGIGQIGLTYAYRMSPATEISVYNYSGIIFSDVLGKICLSENLSTNSLIGGTLVLIAGIIIYKFTPPNNKII